MWSRRAAARRSAATHVAIGPITEELLAALLVPRTEPIGGTAAGLTDREIRGRPRRRRLAFLARQRGSNQRPVHGAFKLLDFGTFVPGRVGTFVPGRVRGF